MIALERKKPTSCVFCPCCGTYFFDFEGKEHGYRRCAAKGLMVCDCSLEGEIPQIWDEPPMPDWCPWIEIDKTEDKP